MEFGFVSSNLQTAPDCSGRNWVRFAKPANKTGLLDPKWVRSAKPAKRDRPPRPKWLRFANLK
jgi:hypothetical protein